MSIDFDIYYANRNQDNKYLFHYTNEYIALENILSFRRLKFSKRINSHDPLEKQSINHVYINFKTEEMIEYETKINRIRDNIKYCCFCIDKDTISSFPFEKGCFRSRMWSQYANGHKGICLIFNYKKLFERTLDYFDPPNGWSMSSRVSYENDDTKISDSLQINHKDNFIEPDKRLRKLCNVYLFSKLKDYEHENEYRICINDDNENNETIMLDFTDSLEGIILGHCFNPIYNKLVNTFSETYSVPLRQINWYNRIPTLDRINV